MASGAAAAAIHVEETVIEKKAEGKIQSFRILKLDFLDSIRLRFYGNVKVGTIMRGDEPTDLYAFNCERHGLQLATPSGWSNRLVCEDCIKEIELQNMRIAEEHAKTDKGSLGNAREDQLSKYLVKNAGKNL